MVLNAVPGQEPGSGPNYFSFDDNVLYELHVDNNQDGDAEDVRYQIRFQPEQRTPDQFIATLGGGPLPPVSHIDGPGSEGLSRVLANDMVPGVEPQDFVSAPVWLDQPSDETRVRREDWVTKTDRTDVNYFSIGCSVLFLNWLRFQLNFPWAKIIAAGGSTLGETYKNLTGKSDGWTVFKALIDDTYPPGRPSGLKTDNPFPLTPA